MEEFFLAVDVADLNDFLPETLDSMQLGQDRMGKLWMKVEGKEQIYPISQCDSLYGILACQVKEDAVFPVAFVHDELKVE